MRGHLRLLSSSKWGLTAIDARRHPTNGLGGTAGGIRCRPPTCGWIAYVAVKLTGGAAVESIVRGRIRLRGRCGGGCSPGWRALCRARIAVAPPHGRGLPDMVCSALRPWRYLYRCRCWIGPKWRTNKLIRPDSEIWEAMRCEREPKRPRRIRLGWSLSCSADGLWGICASSCSGRAGRCERETPDRGGPQNGISSSGSRPERDAMGPVPRVVGFSAVVGSGIHASTTDLTGKG